MSGFITKEVAWISREELKHLKSPTPGLESPALFSPLVILLKIPTLKASSWLSVEHVTFDLWVLSSSPMLDVEIT